MLLLEPRLNFVLELFKKKEFFYLLDLYHHLIDQLLQIQLNEKENLFNINVKLL
jgi:hypothetical protein